VEAARAEELRRPSAADVELVEGGPGRDVLAAAAGEVVEDVDAVPARHEGVCDVGADESGAAGNEDVHALSGVKITVVRFSGANISAARSWTCCGVTASM